MRMGIIPVGLVGRRDRVFVHASVRQLCQCSLTLEMKPLLVSLVLLLWVVMLLLEIVVIVWTI